MNKLRQWYGNLKFRKKVLFCMLLASLLPVVFLGIFCYFQCRNLLIQREQEMLSQTLEQNITILTGNVNLYKSYMDSLVWNDNLQQALESEYEDNLQMYVAYRDTIDPVIFNMENLDSAVKQVTIYSTNDTLYPHGTNFLPAERMEVGMDELERGKVLWDARPDTNELNMYCKMFSEYGRYENALLISLDYSKVFSIFTNLFSDDYGIEITGSDGNIIFSFAQNNTDHNTQESAVKRTADVEGEKDYVVKTEKISPVNWRAELKRPVSEISAAARSITVLVLIVILGCCALVAFLSLTLTRSITKPVNKLVENIEQIELGSMSVDVVNESQDEIGHLFRSFKRMMERLNDMINQVYQSRILQQQYEMKALQAQINPHFLYNSLSLINWKAIMAEQTEISEMAQLLSTFYRTTLNKGKNTISVKGEWDNTCSYVKIQQMLHSGKFEAVLEIDENILNYHMINLLLQPLVENAIIHGLDHKETEGKKRLEIHGREKKDELIFTVSDNGCGMSEKTMENILIEQTKGYGVQNVHHRIQLYYGEEYGLSYESKINEGTTVTLIIPKRTDPDNEKTA